MKKVITIFILLTINLSAQSHWFSLPTYWERFGFGVGINIEAFDLDKDNHKDIFIANFNTTDVFFGGPGILDDTADVTYTGKCIAICDFNGDSFQDIIALHFTNYDSLREDYDGNMLFYYGSDTTSLAIDTVADYSVPIPTLYPHLGGFAVGNFKFGTQSGDLNNDGFDDLVISEYEYFNEPGGVDVGKIYIYIGNQIPDSIPSFFVEGTFNLSNGIYIRDVGRYFEVGDINGDNLKDLLISVSQRTHPPNSQDSLETLLIFYGGENFDFQLGSESLKYESRVDRQIHWSEWFRKNFSLDDINCDGIEDLVVGGIGLPEETTNVHYGNPNGIDTIPSFQVTDPDTSDPTIWAGGISYNIGDFNNDSYDDFILSLSGYKSFTLHLGGPYVSNNNRYGLKGLLDANPFFPQKAIDVGDQDGDGINDFAINSSAYDPDRIGYVIMMRGRDIPVSVEKEEKNELKGFELNQNYPNPFNPQTMIYYTIESRQKISIKVFDILGREIETLINQVKPAGEYEVKFDGSSLSSGIYFYQLKAGSFVETKKMILLK